MRKQERGKRNQEKRKGKEERGKRNEERGKKKGERGTRKEERVKSKEERGKRNEETKETKEQRLRVASCQLILSAMFIETVSVYFLFSIIQTTDKLV